MDEKKQIKYNKIDENQSFVRNIPNNIDEFMILLINIRRYLYISKRNKQISRKKKIIM